VTTRTLAKSHVTHACVASSTPADHTTPRYATSSGGVRTLDVALAVTSRGQPRRLIGGVDRDTISLPNA
jgi:hypothetical protein